MFKARILATLGLFASLTFVRAYFVVLTDSPVLTPFLDAATLSALKSETQTESNSPAAPVKQTDAAVTDFNKIVGAVQLVNPKVRVNPDNGPPGHAPAATLVTVLDGEVVNQPVSKAKRSFHFMKRYLSKFVRRHRGPTHVARQVGGFKKIFGGTGTERESRDASIQGSSYLTYTVIPNDGNYNADACVEFCSNIKGCVFVNLYYEYNNPGLDAGGSNLKCAAYGDIHFAEEKTNWGGQDLGGAGPTYIQESSGYAKIGLVEPSPPAGYDYVFGPVNASNNAAGVSFNCSILEVPSDDQRSIWDSLSLTIMTSMRAPNCAIPEVTIVRVVLVSSSTFGEQSSMKPQPHIPVRWYAFLFFLRAWLIFFR